MWNRRKISIHRGMPHEPNTVAVVARKTFGGTLKIHAVLVPGIEALFWSRRALLAYAEPHFKQWEADQRETSA